MNAMATLDTLTSSVHIKINTSARPEGGADRRGESHGRPVRDRNRNSSIKATGSDSDRSDYGRSHSGSDGVTNSNSGSGNGAQAYDWVVCPSWASVAERCELHLGQTRFYSERRLIHVTRPFLRVRCPGAYNSVGRKGYRTVVDGRGLVRKAAIQGVIDDTATAGIHNRDGRRACGRGRKPRTDLRHRVRRPS